MSSIIERTLEASQQWKTFFNQGNAQGCASMYEADAVMVAAPFGQFTGRAAIEEFWKNLVEQGFSDVVYLDTEVEQVSEDTTLLRSNWTMNNAAGVITRELWVSQQDGSMRLREDHFEALSTNE